VVIVLVVETTTSSFAIAYEDRLVETPIQTFGLRETSPLHPLQQPPQFFRYLTEGFLPLSIVVSSVVGSSELEPLLLAHTVFRFASTKDIF
jgi:hypothetical protein